MVPANGLFCSRRPPIESLRGTVRAAPRARRRPITRGCDRGAAPWRPPRSSKMDGQPCHGGEHGQSEARNTNARPMSPHGRSRWAVAFIGRLQSFLQPCGRSGTHRVGCGYQGNCTTIKFPSPLSFATRGSRPLCRGRLVRVRGIRAVSYKAAWSAPSPDESRRPCYESMHRPCDPRAQHYSWQRRPRPSLGPAFPRPEPP